MEVLGAVSGSIAVFECCVKIVEALKNLVERLKHLPSRIRDHIELLNRLAQTAHFIRDTPALQTPVVFSHLENTLSHVSALQKHLDTIAALYLKGSKARRYILVAFTGSWEEDRITKRILDLERHQAALGLSVTVAHTDILTKIQGDVTSLIDHTQTLPHQVKLNTTGHSKHEGTARMASLPDRDFGNFGGARQIPTRLATPPPDGVEATEPKTLQPVQNKSLSRIAPNSSSPRTTTQMETAQVNRTGLIITVTGNETTAGAHVVNGIAGNVPDQISSLTVSNNKATGQGTEAINGLAPYPPFVRK